MHSKRYHFDTGYLHKVNRFTQHDEQDLMPVNKLFDGAGSSAGRQLHLLFAFRVALHSLSVTLCL